MQSYLDLVPLSILLMVWIVGPASGCVVLLNSATCFVSSCYSWFSFEIYVDVAIANW